MTDTAERSLVSGSLWGSLGRFALPYLLSYFLQTLYGMADLYIVGQFNPIAATTAVSIGSQVMHMLTVILVGLAMGSTVVIGRAVGGQRHREAMAAVGNTVLLFLALSAVLTVALLLSVRPILAAMSTPAAAVEGAARYLTICFAGIPFICAYNILAAIFRGLGDTKSPLYFVALACLVNILLDLLFIGALGLGPAGAALGTTLAQGASVAFALLWMRRGASPLTLTRQDLRPSRPVLGDILRVGLPIMAQDALIQIAFLLITIIANRRGLYDAAAVGVVEKIIGVLFLVPSTMLSTVSALSAQCLGAQKPQRARGVMWRAMGVTVAFGLLASLLIQFTAPAAVGLFSSDPPEEVLRLGGQYLRSYVWDCMLAGVHFCFSGYFCALGRSSISFLHNALSICVRVPGAYLASRLFADTLYPMGLAAPAGSLLSVLICLGAYLWLRRRGEPTLAPAQP